MNYSTKMNVTVEAICLIAKAKIMNAGTIAKKLDIPVRYLEQVLQKLTDEGVLKGQRGPAGGYSLVSPAHKTNLRTIIICVRLCQPTTTKPKSNKIVQAVFDYAENELWETLRKITIADLI